VKQLYGAFLPEAAQFPEGLTYALADEDLRALGAEHEISAVAVLVSPDRRTALVIVEGTRKMTPGAGEAIRLALVRRELPLNARLQTLPDEQSALAWAAER
jgi:hypothetical protein